MSILSNLSRGIGSISRTIRNFFSPRGGLMAIARLCSRSYGNGILVTYNLTGGNEAIELSSSPISTDNLNPFELFLHFTVSFAWAFGIIGSITAHTYRSVYNTILNMTKKVLPKANQESNTTTDNRSTVAKYSIGLPGIFIGIILGSGISIVISAGRIISNSWKSMQFVATKMMNSVLPDQIETEQEPSAVLRYLVGAPGLPLGAVIGAIGVAAISVGRIVSNSWKSMVFVTTKMTNLVLPEEIKTEQESSSILRYLIGAPGLPLGAVIGTVGVAAVSVGRIVSNSWKSMVFVTTKMTNLVLPEEIKTEQESSSILRYLVGAPGLPLGAIIGTVGIAAVSVGRIVSNSFKSMVFVTTQMTNLVLPEKIIPENEPSAVLRYLVGAPGLLLGTVVGTVGIAAVSIGRVISNSWKSMVHITKTMTNFALHESDQFSTKNRTVAEEKEKTNNEKTQFISNSDPSERSSVLKYLIGAPGIILGLLIGAIGFTSVVFGRVLINSSYTFFDVSGAFLNVALEREVFDGLQNESTLQKRWGFGFPGALLSLSVAALGASILTMRKAIPISLGLITSPLTALWRLSRESWKY